MKTIQPILICLSALLPQVASADDESVGPLMTAWLQCVQTRVDELASSPSTADEIATAALVTCRDAETRFVDLFAKHREDLRKLLPNSATESTAALLDRIERNVHDSAVARTVTRRAGETPQDQKP